MYMEQESSTALQLAHNQHLTIEQDGSDTLLRLSGADGVVTVSISVTAKGPVISLEGADLIVRAKGLLALGAQDINIHATRSLALTSEQDLLVTAARDLITSGESQTIRAILGDVRVKANDDVRLDGERVRVNC
jgi:uncharacterized protein (DUF2345 family)